MDRLGPGSIVMALAVVAAGCAPALSPTTASDTASATASTTIVTRRQCFSATNVNGFRLVDDQTVDLTVGASRVFRAELFGTCPDVRDAVSVAVRTRTGSSYVCDDQDLELIVPGSLGPRLCPVTALRMRSAAELQAERTRR